MVKTINKRIVRMVRFGRKWTVTLECGHSFSCTGEYSKEHQLYIGKAIICSQKHKETTNNDHTNNEHI